MTDLSPEFIKIRKAQRRQQFIGKLLRIKITPTRLRDNMAKNMIAREPEGVRYIEVDARGVPSAWLVPDGADMSRRMLHLHGGGYVAGDIQTHRAYGGYVARAAGIPVLMADYRLGPEHVFPAALEDGIAAFEFMCANGPDGPAEAEKTIIAGDSAGGGLSLSVMMALRDRGKRLPDAAVLLSPWADLVCEAETMQTRAKADPLVGQDWLKACAEAYAPGVDKADPQLSPVLGDFRGLPPMAILVGDAEVLLDDSLEVAKKARAAGVRVDCEVFPEMVHIWPVLFPFIPEGAQAIEKVAAFIKTV